MPGDIAACAHSALEVWGDRTVDTGPTYGTLGLAVVIVSIEGAESGWVAGAGGDTPAELSAYNDTAAGRAYPVSAATIAAARRYGCPSPTGPSSWGVLQTSVAAHYIALRAYWRIALAHPLADACTLAAWLRSPINSTRLWAYWLGPHPTAATLAGTWTTYHDGSWVDHLADARAAVNAARRGKPPASAGASAEPAGRPGRTRPAALTRRPPMPSSRKVALGIGLAVTVLASVAAVGRR